MTWRDKLTGKTALQPTAPAVPGQWEYVASEPTRIRDVTVRRGDLLLPDEDGRYGGWPDAPVPDSRLVLDEDAERRLRAIGERLAAVKGPWAGWLDCPPVQALLDVAELAEPPLESVMRRCLGALEGVCTRPRTNLTLDEERLLVPRCRRASPRAAQVLAQRSEDWARRTVFGVEPKRVVGYVREEVHDLYENRLALALVDHLDAWLGGRCRSLRRARDAAVQALEYQGLLEGAHWRRAHRISELWGKAYDRSDLLRRVEEALARTQALRRRVLALRDSELARRLVVPRGRSIQLRMTNILANDGAYRRVAELWRAWQESRAGDMEPTAQDRWEAAQATARAYARFVHLVVVRAMHELGFNAVPGDGPCEDLQPTRASWTDLTIMANGRDLFLVAADQAVHPLRIVALPAPLEASASVEAWITHLPEDPHLLIVALPADERHPSAAHRRLRSLGNEGDGQRPGPMVTAAAPWDLESVERVARAIRWYASTAVYGRYPRTVAVPAGWTAPMPPIPHLERTADGLRCITVPRGTGAVWPALDERIRARRARVESIAAQAEAATNRLRMRYRQELEGERQPLERDEAISRELDATIAWTSRIFTCPICASASSMVARDGPCFRATCVDCGADWGMARCPAGHGVPVLTVGGITETRAVVSDVDRAWGSDLLALRSGDSFVCPSCGQSVS